MRFATRLMLILTAFGVALGQPVFEAASIRVRQGAPQWKFETSGTRLMIESYTLFGLVREAYHLQNFQIHMTGASALMQSNEILYDITAKAVDDSTPTRDQFRQMLQALLADRFKLKVHRESVEMPVYALIVGKGGPKFKPSSPDADPTVRVSCTPNCSSNYVLTMPKGTTEDLSRNLGGELDRPAVDQSGLTGTFDIKLTYTPEFRRNSRPEPDLNDISIFTAVQDQLGLKLDPRKAMIEMLVVDHVEKPSEIDSARFSRARRQPDMTVTMALITVFTPLLALAQPAPITFEAASVKPADPKSAPVNRSANAQATLRGGPGTADPGRISYANVTLQSVLITAYGANCKVQDDCDQVVGPAWLQSSRYDIDAKIPAGTTTDQFRIMLQNLLAERFHMTLHLEMRDLPGYELTVAKGKAKLVASPPTEVGSGDPAGPLVKFGAPGEYGKLLRPGFLVFPYKGTRSTANHAIGREQSLADITKLLNELMNAHVVDKTGLTGKYDFTLDWVPDGVTMIQEADGPELAPPHGIPTAIEDQLGLKLVRSKVTLDTVIVDSADKVPAEN